MAEDRPIKGLCPDCGAVAVCDGDEGYAGCNECGWGGRDSELVTHGFTKPGLFTRTTEMGAGLIGPPLGPQPFMAGDPRPMPETLGEVMKPFLPLAYEKGEKLCLSGFGDDIDGTYEIIDADDLELREDGSQGQTLNLKLWRVEETEWKGESKVEILPGTVPAQGGPHPPSVHADEVGLMDEDGWVDLKAGDPEKIRAERESGERIPAKQISVQEMISVARRQVWMQKEEEIEEYRRINTEQKHRIRELEARLVIEEPAKIHHPVKEEAEKPIDFDKALDKYPTDVPLIDECSEETSQPREEDGEEHEIVLPEKEET